MVSQPPANGPAPDGSRVIGVRSIGDVLAFVTLLAMLLSAVAWGLKLEGELNALREDVVDNSAAIGAGILPRAEERIERVNNHMDRLADRLILVEEICTERK